VTGNKEDLDAMVRGAKAATVSSDVEARSNVRHDRARINATFLAFCSPAFRLFLALVIVILEPTKLCLPPESEQWPTRRLNGSNPQPINDNDVACNVVHLSLMTLVLSYQKTSKTVSFDPPTNLSATITMFKLLVGLLALSLSSWGVSAWVAPSRPTTAVSLTATTGPKQEDVATPPLWSGAAALGLALVLVTSPAQAAYSPDISSLLVATETKILDMSLPSYDDLKDTRASVENVPGLAIPAAELASKGPIGLSTYSSTEASRKTESSSSSSLSDNKFVTSLLPSVGKAGPK
jgi:hypothetical protein